MTGLVSTTETCVVVYRRARTAADILPALGVIACVVLICAAVLWTWVHVVNQRHRREQENRMLLMAETSWGIYDNDPTGGKPPTTHTEET